MENKNEKRSEQEQTKQEQPGNLSSFNNRDEKKSTKSEKAEEKDESTLDNGSLKKNSFNAVNEPL